MMAPLRADGYYHLDDRGVAGSSGNLDHVLIGPARVFVIDAKNWSGQLRIDGMSLRQNGRRRDDQLERVRVQAVYVSTIIEKFMGPRRVEVRPAICFTGEARLERRIAVDRVHVLNSSELVAFIRGLDRKLDQRSVDEVMRGLLERLPPRSSRRDDPPVRAAATRAPEDLLLFLQPWTKHGHRRLQLQEETWARSADAFSIWLEMRNTPGSPTNRTNS